MGADLIDYDMRIEDEFNIRIPDQDAVGLMTFGEMHEYLCRRLPSLDREAVWERQLRVLGRFRRFEPSQLAKVTPSDHFVKDLGFS
jgi:acyl carrier protein